MDDHRGLIQLARIQEVEVTDTSFYSRFAASDLDMLQESTSQLVREVMESPLPPQGFMKALLGAMVFPAYDRNSLVDMPLGQSCIPGSKMAIDYTGTIHMCEKINRNYPIGTVWAGLNYAKISDYVNEFLQARYDSCSGCSLSRLCGTCFASMAESGDNSFAVHPAKCNETFPRLKGGLITLYSLLEQGKNLG